MRWLGQLDARTKLGPSGVSVTLIFTILCIQALGAGLWCLLKGGPR